MHPHAHHGLLKPTIRQTPRAAPATTRTARALLHHYLSTKTACISPPSARPNRDRQALRPTASGSLTGEHAVVDGEVAADHVRLLGGAVAGEGFAGVGYFGAVFAVVDADFAVEALAGADGFVVRVWPLAALADAWRGKGSAMRKGW